MIKISPSILSADYANLERDIRRVEDAGADYIHVDVMDGVFVPNITVGIPVVRALRKVTRIPLDVHLMIEHPERYARQFVEAGADILTFHEEACADSGALIDRIRSMGAKPSISIKPATPVEAVVPYLDRLSMVLLMTVEPGFGGQKMDGSVLPKIQKLRKIIKSRCLDCDLEADGGITMENARELVHCGINVIVAGSAIYCAADPGAAIAELRRKTEVN